jgi:hypothetical protein
MSISRGIPRTPILTKGHLDGFFRCACTTPVLAKDQSHGSKFKYNLLKKEKNVKHSRTIILCDLVVRKKNLKGGKSFASFY